jgi:hypothetical protein
MTPATPRPDDLPAPDRPAGCAAFEAMVNAVLDRELGPDALDGDHSAGCAECRALAVAARQLLVATFAQPRPPSGFTERVVAVAVRDRRARRRLRLVGAALAASVLAGTTVYLLRPTSVETREFVHVPPAPDVVPEAPPPRVSDRFAEAGSALVAITNRVKEQTVNPPRTLLPPSEAVTVPKAGAVPGIEPVAESLAGMPEAARSGIEPVADKSRRAVNLFLRDVGLGPNAKPKL